MKGMSETTEPQSSSPSTSNTTDVSSSEETKVETKVETTVEDQQPSVQTKTTLWSSFISTTFSVFESCSDRLIPERSRKSTFGASSWSLSVKKAYYSDTMKRLQDRFLGSRWAGSSSQSNCEIWLLGICYKIAADESSENSNPSQDNQDFVTDFSSRICITYRKGFELIQETKYDNDVGWGCMIRSGQMLVAQALLVHHLGRSWRRPTRQPFEQEYLEILQCFGDSASEACPFSIHNLLEAGKAYELVPGEWLGPYAMCRSWESLAQAERRRYLQNNQKVMLPMAIYVVSGNEYGEAGGAPALCIEDAVRLCTELSETLKQATIALLILVPLLLGVDKINSRYLPSLSQTFSFPQSLGIVGGKRGNSTYLVGVQDDQAIYLDPHTVQQAVDLSKDNSESAFDSYHSRVVRHIPLSDLDPSLAIGFYCRNREDLDDLCIRASQMAEQSNGAPLFTVTESLKAVPTGSSLGITPLDNDNVASPASSEDDWQIL